jgi:hypothetical protein
VYRRYVLRSTPTFLPRYVPIMPKNGHRKFISALQWYTFAHSVYFIVDVTLEDCGKRYVYVTFCSLNYLSLNISFEAHNYRCRYLARHHQNIGCRATLSRILLQKNINAQIKSYIPLYLESTKPQPNMHGTELQRAGDVYAYKNSFINSR